MPTRRSRFRPRHTARDRVTVGREGPQALCLSRVPDIFSLQGRLLGFFGSILGSAIGAGGLIYWHGSVRQADGTDLFPLILESSLFAATTVLATLTGLRIAAFPVRRSPRVPAI